MLTHSRPNIRKRAILALYKVLSKYPDAATTGLPRLKDRLQDSDLGLLYVGTVKPVLTSLQRIGVIAATVNVICELARQKPEEFLPLAPQLFHLLTTSTNNWMLIKIIKLVREIPYSQIPKFILNPSLDHYAHTNHAWSRSSLVPFLI